MIVLIEKSYPDCDIRCWNKTSKSCQKENMERHINNWGCQINEKVWQCWSYPQKEHIVQQLIPTFCYLNTQKIMLSLIKQSRRSVLFKNDIRINTSAWKNLNLSGQIQITKGLPINLDNKKQEHAPAVALKTTRIRPLITPNRDPASKDIKSVPGIIKVCMKMYVEQ